MITILDIIKELKWKDVKRAIKYYYPWDKSNYETLFYDLQKFKKQTPKNKEVIEIFCYKDEKFCLKEKNPIACMIEDDYYSIATNKYSMMFRKWQELVNIPISEETLKHYKFQDIVAHFIYEITFCGDEKETQKVANQVLKDSKEAIKIIDQNEDV